MEYIKNDRDQNALHFIDGSLTSKWLDGLVTVSNGAGSGPCDFGKTCTVDATASLPGSVATCTGACNNIRRDSNTGLMGYNGSWTLTNFKRTVQFQDVETGEEVKFIITLSWTQGSTNKSFQISQSLFNRLQ